MENKTIKMRSGTRDYGKSYEFKMTALLATRLALDSTVADFQMVCNVDDVGDFDDIVIKIEDQNGSMSMYCIQLKHKESGILQISAFDKELHKYVKSYNEIKDNINKNDLFENVNLQQVHLVYYTNAPLRESSKDNSIMVQSINSNNFLSTSAEGGTIFKISHVPTSSQSFDKNFLSQFYLYTNQAKEQKLNDLVIGEICQKFEHIKITSIESLLNVFSVWCLGRNGKITTLSKKSVGERLLEFTLLPYNLYPKNVGNANKCTMETLRKTLVSFNVTNVSQPDHLNVIFAMIKCTISETCDIAIDDSLPWNAIIAENQLNTIYNQTFNKDKDLIRRKLQERQQFLLHPILRDIYFSAWGTRITPMILDCTSAPELIVEVLTAFEYVTKGLSFVLLGPVSTIIENLHTFENLCCIDDETLFDRNIDTLSISLQDKIYMSLKQLSVNREIFRELKPDAYLSLLMTPPSLGLKNDDSAYYIKRVLIKPILDKSLLWERKRDFLIIIGGEGKLSMRIHANYIMDLKTYLKSIIEQKEDIYILTTNEALIELVKEAKVLHDFTKKNVHILELKYNYDLEWMHSEGSICDLKKYISTQRESILSEDTLVNDQISMFKIICGNAGMGKTSLLKAVAGNFGKTELTIYVNLSDHVSQIESYKSIDGLLEYLLRQQTKNLEECTKEFVYNIILSLKNHTTWLFDGYDEVASSKILSFLRKMKGKKVWITTRPTLKNDLENNLGSLSYELTCFNGEDNHNFLHKYLENHHKYGKTNIDSIVQWIEKCFSSLDDSFVGIPLQTKMFAEVFGFDQDYDGRRFTIVQLYNNFIDINLKKYKHYEAIKFEETLSNHALIVFYSRDTLKHLIKFDELDKDTEAFMYDYKKDFLMTGINDNGEIIFGHRTFAEFLAARWLTKNILDKKSGNLNHQWLPLVKMLFWHEMRPVRLFFDRILSESLVLHSAVLENDEKKVVELLRSNDSVTVMDILGRSALQLAVTYGTFYDIYDGHITLHIYTDKLVERAVLDTGYQVSLDVIEKLIDHGFSNIKDRLGYNLLDSAMKSCSLEVVNSLCRKFRTEILLLEDEIEFEHFVYLIVCRNLHHILSKSSYHDFSELSVIDNLEIRDIFLERKESLSLKYVGEYLTEIAAHCGSKEILFILLSTGILSIDQGLPLHKACKNGQSETVRMLCKMGADIEKYWIRGTPLYLACTNGHINCIEALLESGADAMKRTLGEISYLDHGIYTYQLESIKFLLAKVDFPMEYIENACFNAIGLTAFEMLLDHIDVNIVDNQGNTLLMLACKKGSLYDVKLLISTNKCNLNVLNPLETFLNVSQWAQRMNHSLLWMKLISVGPKPWNTGKGGMGALHFAVSGGHGECVEALLDAGADKHLEDEVEGFGYTPLVWASLFGQEEITRILVSSKYEAEHVHEIELALRWATNLGYRDCVKHLLDLVSIIQGSIEVSEHIETIISTGILLVARPVTLNDALHWAARMGEIEYVRDLLKLGADAYSKICIGGMRYYPIIWASIYGHLDVVEVFLKNMDKKDLENKDLHSALNWACVGDHDYIVELLVDFGFDVDAIDHNLTGNTPLISFCQYGFESDILRILITEGCNVLLQNFEGKTALDILVEDGRTYLLKEFLIATRGKKLEIDMESSTHRNLSKLLAGFKDNLELTNRLAELGVGNNILD